jgi:hypothetical protein
MSAIATRIAGYARRSLRRQLAVLMQDTPQVSGGGD